MENTKAHIQPLLESSEEYIRNGIQLNKLRFLDVFAETAANGISRLLLILFISLFVFSTTIALALWLGEILGKNHYGFLLVAGLYALAALMVLGLHRGITGKINSALIKQIFKP